MPEWMKLVVAVIVGAVLSVFLGPLGFPAGITLVIYLL